MLRSARRCSLLAATVAPACGAAAASWLLCRDSLALPRCFDIVPLYSIALLSRFSLARSGWTAVMAPRSAVAAVHASLYSQIRQEHDSASGDLYSLRNYDKTTQKDILHFLGMLAVMSRKQL